ncbi:26s proteasome non-atpase regulatory subunit 14 [Stylonychia lemnae]|uniref:26s proteasome non-atpase regulatory subunit 14 n=1 Tax=Stylonychia lemnae TaxID=5949 RepID=A0A077ZRI3_STYLE|nr:26s proteasome non-atpase regulatory subunit 14 [Stylonychia lemnae]|eukprot:CDW72074.1 26s proteasome non-atpase regulatory subunit 14 [Stylonychia lemnae]
MQGANRQRGHGAVEMPLPDTGEQIYISSLALLKMLKHARSGIPFEVMGLMVGEIHDDYTITVVDVFSMPQKGTTISVESVDPVFQQQFMDMMKQVGRDQMCVGWYHSHPGFGPWLSGTDVETQKSQEMLNPRAVAVVVDPVQSVKGKVVIDAFRSIDPQVIMQGIEPRQTTSNIGHITKPALVAIAHGLGKYYYNIALNYRKNEFEQKMLLNLNKVNWSQSLKNLDYKEHQTTINDTLKNMAKLTEDYNKWIQEENKKTHDEFVVSSVGKMNPKNHLTHQIDDTLHENVMECLGTMLNTVVF